MYQVRSPCVDVHIDKRFTCSGLSLLRMYQTIRFHREVELNLACVLLLWLIIRLNTVFHGVPQHLISVPEHTSLELICLLVGFTSVVAKINLKQVK